MRCTNVHFRTPNDVPPNLGLKHLLYKTRGMLTVSDGVPRQFDDGTWEVIFYAVSEPDLTDHADHVREGRAVLTRYGCEIVSETDFTPKFSFSGLIEGLCKRPDMYTGHDTFDSVMDFLHGFLNGIACCQEAPNAAGEALKQWEDFALVWLRERFDDYQYPISGLRAAYSEDKAALENLAALWAEYRASDER